MDRHIADRTRRWFGNLPRYLFAPNASPPGYLATRWFFLRSLGLIFLSVFYSLLFQIRGLIGPTGLLPAGEYLVQVARALGPGRIWFAPSLFWWSTSDGALMAVCIAGLVAAVLLTLNIFPRGALLVCMIAFLSFISVAQDFAGYQSDGMLLEAGFISLFFAPAGWRPRWGASDPPSRASRFLLIWLWFRIYFESGMVKILSHDLQWRNFTAMDLYYQNGPLPTWIAWYAHHLPHWFHASTAFLTLALELVVIFAVFLPRRGRILLFLIVTPWQIGIILTSNYAFLNYLVLVLGFLLLDNRFLARFLPIGAREEAKARQEAAHFGSTGWRDRFRLGVQGVSLTWISYVTTALLLGMLLPADALPNQPVRALAPFRIANQYGLFAVMTPARYEIEFQGSPDGVTWTPYPFRYKPQDPHAASGIYAPYQPRFEWNLWFASLGTWRQNLFVLAAEQRLLANDRNVLSLFARNPFPAQPPKQVRAVLWQYWFSDRQEKREKGLWWDRDLIGAYAPTIEREDDGSLVIIGRSGRIPLTPEP